MVKRERWTEAEVDALPPGEHDYFDRKSGLLFGNTHELLATLGKALSAFANTGGGYIVLGVADDGTPDGVPPAVGRTPMREWLEQKVPRLLQYPLADFRVHLAERSSPSRIPAGREVIVIDVGDSALAPHQCVHGGQGVSPLTYYYRQAGRSELAPHFYLELLRQRLVSPVLETRSVTVTPSRAGRVEGGIFLATTLQFLLENVGRVAAYRWAVYFREIEGHPPERPGDYRFGRDQYPAPFKSSDSSITVDQTILPGLRMKDNHHFGVLLRPADDGDAALREEIERMLAPVTLRYRLATETSPGDLQDIRLATVVNAEELTGFVLQQLAA